MTAEEAYSSWLSSQSVNREEIPVTPMAAFLAGYAARPSGDSGTRIADLEAKIAAAVDALEAGRFAIEVTVACLNTWNGGRGSPADTDAILRRMDEALARAQVQP